MKHSLRCEHCKSFVPALGHSPVWTVYESKTYMNEYGIGAWCSRCGRWGTAAVLAPRATALGISAVYTSDTSTSDTSCLIPPKVRVRVNRDWWSSVKELLFWAFITGLVVVAGAIISQLFVK